MRTLRVAFVLALVACGGGDGSTNPLLNGVTNFTAKIDGTDWNAEFAPVASNPSPGLYVISGFRSTGANPYTIAISLTNVAGAAPYRLGVNTMMYGGTVVLSAPPSSGWTTTLDGDAGELVITTLTATRIAGTFQFVADPLSGTTGTRTVTEGQFDVPVTGTGGLAPANKGSVATFDLGGTLVLGAQAVSSITGGNNVLTVVVDSGTRGVTMSIENAVNGTHALSGTRTIFVGGIPSVGSVWRTDMAGGSGSVTLNITADRISGTFTAVAVGAAGGASGTMNITGTFSLGRGL